MKGGTTYYFLPYNEAKEEEIKNWEDDLARRFMMRGYKHMGDGCYRTDSTTSSEKN
jgi:hypothetical protein